jgi:hypothetical protein
MECFTSLSGRGLLVRGFMDEPHPVWLRKYELQIYSHTHTHTQLYLVRCLGILHFIVCLKKKKHLYS